MNPLTYFAEISRIDEEKRIVEGFCRTTGRVKSDPYDLTFKTLKRAAEGYREWSNVREMHGPSAAGVCKNLDFIDPDERIFIRAEISDDQAWRKIKSGTYKGFSIGGRPTLLRGNEVVDFLWTEISLVDRPADPGATITLFRRDDGPEDPVIEAAPEVERAVIFGCDAGHQHSTAQESAECIRLSRAGSPQPDYAAGDAGPNIGVPESLQTQLQLVGYQHFDCGSMVCHGHKQHAAAVRCQTAQMSRAEIHIPDEATDDEAAELVQRAETAVEVAAEVIADSEPPAADAATPADAEDEMTPELTERLDKLAADNAALVARLDAMPTTETITRLEASVTTLTDENVALKAEIKRIGDLPAGAPVVRHTTGAAMREFVQRQNATTEGQTAEAKIARLEELRKMEVPQGRRQQDALVEETLRLQTELNEMGMAA